MSTLASKEEGISEIRRLVMTNKWNEKGRALKEEGAGDLAGKYLSETNMRISIVTITTARMIWWSLGRQ